MKKLQLLGLGIVLFISYQCKDAKKDTKEPVTEESEVVVTEEVEDIEIMVIIETAFQNKKR